MHLSSKFWIFIIVMILIVSLRYFYYDDPWSQCIILNYFIGSSSHYIAFDIVMMLDLKLSYLLLQRY